MTTRAQQFAEAIRRGLTERGLTRDMCAGWQWLDRTMERHPNVSIASLGAQTNQMIGQGKADDGWLRTALCYAWAEMSEDERILFFQYLSLRGAHKGLLNRAAYPARMTDREAQVYEQLLRDTKQVKAADRFVRERSLEPQAGLRRG